MRIWTGRAGSGKTTAILREIAALSEKGEGRQILLVPELNSHLMERRLAAATHNHGARTAEVLTFSRLADRVFSEVGGLAQQMLTPAGQLLTLQEAARRVQGGLRAWKGLADKPELLQEALRLIDECKTCAVAPETLFAAAEESEDAVLAEKLSVSCTDFNSLRASVRGVPARPERPSDTSARPSGRKSHAGRRSGLSGWFSRLYCAGKCSG